MHVIVGSACALLAVTAHVLQITALGPWAVKWPTLGSWPVGFHLWLLETCLVSVWLLSLALERNHARLSHWWHTSDADRRTAALSSTLLALQVLLGAAFWLTRDQGVDKLGGLRAAFWLGGEFRVPTAFAVLQAWLAAWFAWRVYRRERKLAWGAAACVCGYIGADELLSIHESIGAAVREAGWVEVGQLNTVALWGGVRAYTWQLIFAPLAAGIGLWLLKAFWRELGAGSLALLVLAALVFVSGALGFETAQATASVHSHGWQGSDRAYFNLLAEETLETLGMTIALAVFARSHWRQ